MNTPGLFVVVEGPDGAGKTTLVTQLESRLRTAGIAAVRVREPGGTPAAEWARRGAFDPELNASDRAELFFVLAARADLVTRIIRPALGAGDVVLSDRFDLSTEAYQIAGRCLPAEAVRVANRLATDGLTPDVTLVLDVPAAVGRARQESQGKELDRMEREQADLHDRVNAAFRAATGPGIHHLDATAEPAAVADAAWAVIAPHLTVRRRGTSR